MPRIDLGNRKHADLDKLPNNCPYCHKSIAPKFITHNFSNDNLDVLFRCPNTKCNRAFIGIYYYYMHDRYNFISTNIGEIEKIEFSEHINSLSQNFVKIYNQAHFAENHELFEICGVGYRKALEFLIKDYLIIKDQEKEEEIKKKFLGNCINEDVDDAKVKKVAKRAVWLGNDETHYVRKWEGKNLTDLKNLIKLTIHWIEMDYLTEELESDMPE